jgi:error-prone DNA polymerase
MPDLPPQKGHLHPAKTHAARSAADGAAPPVRYAELCCASNFSFQRGASHPDELVLRAAELGYAALALTDEESLAGVVRAHVAAKATAPEKGGPPRMPLIIGAQLRLEDAARVVVLATDRASYGRLSRLLTLGRRRAAKGSCVLRRDDVLAHADGLLAIGLPDESALTPWSGREALADAALRLAWLQEGFGERAWLGAALHDGPDDRARLARLDHLSAATRLELVAVGDVDAHVESRRALRDTLTAIRLGCTVGELGARVPADGVRVLRPIAELLRVHRGREELLERTVAIAQRCTFSLDELRYTYPVEGDHGRLVDLTLEGARERWPGGVPDKVARLLAHELKLVAEMNYESYFLTVHELVHFARSRGILCQGRGSAANSAVCYCLGITSIDPDRFDVLFERFLSKERDEPPDIDVDFEHERREEVLQHLWERYGRDRCAMTATLISYRGRSAVRDVGKALGLTLDSVERLAGALQWWDEVDWPDARLREAGVDPGDANVRRVVALSRELHGFPRHLSQHVGGMVMTDGRLDELCPIENAAMEGRTVLEWDKDDLDALGILKVDCLALGMLTAIRKTFDLVAQARGVRWTLATIPADDAATWEMVQRADTIGVFQIESRAQMAMLPRLKPARFYDLVIEVAIVRPGPIQGGMVHPYLRRRAGKEQVDYPSEAVRGVLEKTLGVPIFQEQAMKLAVVAAGFTPGEADQLRRAMGAWRRPGLIAGFERKLVDGMRARGYTLDFAQRLFEQLKGFGEYGFPESHAASFALLTWVSCWLKCHEPAAFCCALLNSQPMGFYEPAQLVRDAQAHGVTVAPVDVARSEYDSTLEGEAVRLGFSRVRGLGRAAAERIVAARAVQTFRSVEECVRRARLARRDATRLAAAGAFAALEGNRREAWWEAAPGAEEAPLFAVHGGDTTPELPAPTSPEIVVADYSLTGLSLEAHPLFFLREALARRGVVPAAALRTAPHGSTRAVAGLVLHRQRPATASGILFMTLEDESGVANLIVRRREQERHRAAVVSGRLLVVRGRVERAEGVVHVVARRFDDLTGLIADLPTSSRDFH